MAEWQHLSVIYDATVGLHYRGSATATNYYCHSVRTKAEEPIQKRSGFRTGSEALKAPTMLFKLFVRRLKSNFSLQLLLKITVLQLFSAAFLINK